MPYSEDKPLRSSSTRTAVHLVLLSLFLTVPLHVYPELADSAFYRAAKHLHLHDINVFLESFSASSSSSPTPFRKLLERESPPIADIVDLVARHANPEHRPSVNRIQRIVSQHHVDNNHPKDLFHGVLHEWLTDLVQDHTTVAPEDFPEKRAYLPRPYSYNSVPKLSEYVKSHREREIVPQYGQSLSYSREPRGAPPTDHVNVEPVTPTEHALFEVILTDFLIDRAVEEVITSSLGKTIKELAKHDAAYLVQAMRAVFEQHDLARDFQSLLPAFRAAAADDLQQLPTRLMQMPAFSSEALVSQFALFESIVSGSIPSHAFSLWPSGNGVPTTRKRGICDEVHLIALLAREWLHYRTYSDTPWNDIVIGGFSLSSIRTHRAERATQPVFMDILFAESPCRRDADASAHLYLEESAAFFELVESVFGQFVRMENEMRRAVLSPSNEKPEPMAIADVISLAVDTIELVENYFHDVGTERERRRLWRRMYLSTIEHRYTDALAAALRYIDLTGTGIGANARRLMALGANIVGAQTGDELSHFGHQRPPTAVWCCTCRSRSTIPEARLRSISVRTRPMLARS